MVTAGAQSRRRAVRCTRRANEPRREPARSVGDTGRSGRWRACARRAARRPLRHSRTLGARTRDAARARARSPCARRREARRSGAVVSTSAARRNARAVRRAFSLCAACGEPSATWNCEPCRAVRRLKRAARCDVVSIACPCCMRSSTRWDVWYDCPCFQGGNARCANCDRARSERDASIAANIRALGWDRNPSPGMLDYLTPGWRPT